MWQLCELLYTCYLLTSTAVGTLVPRRCPGRRRAGRSSLACGLGTPRSSSRRSRPAERRRTPAPPRTPAGTPAAAAATHAVIDPRLPSQTQTPRGSSIGTLAANTHRIASHRPPNHARPLNLSINQSIIRIINKPVIDRRLRPPGIATRP